MFAKNEGYWYSAQRQIVGGIKLGTNFFLNWISRDVSYNAHSAPPSSRLVSARGNYIFPIEFFSNVFKDLVLGEKTANG